MPVDLDQVVSDDVREHLAGLRATVEELCDNASEPLPMARVARGHLAV